MIFIIRALPQLGKDDEYYDSPTSRDETSDFIKIKEAKESPRKNKSEKKRKKIKIKKREKKREGAMLLSFYHTCASE